MLASADALRDSAELYRQLTADATVDVGRDVRREHLELRDAALGRDPEKAADLLETHLRRTAELISAILPGDS
jgi:DNA-binding GntR family transcriptional regulator